MYFPRFAAVKLTIFQQNIKIIHRKRTIYIRQSYIGAYCILHTRGFKLQH